MSHRRWLTWSFVLPLGLMAAGALSQPLRAVPKGRNAPAKSYKPLGNSDGSIFSEVIPAELQQQVTVKPVWLPLSKLLSSFQDTTKVPLTRAPSVPNDPLFIAASSRNEFALLHQVRLLLTDDLWQCQWANTELGKDHRAYRLWREAVSPQQRRAKMAQAAKDRLAKLLALLAAGPVAWDAARADDPNLSNDIRQPLSQAPLLLAGELSTDQLDGVLSGMPLTLSVAEMSPQDQALARQAVAAIPNDNYQMQATNNITGQTRIAFDIRHLPTRGELVFESKPLGDDPGTLGLSMSIFSEPEHEMGAGGGEMLYPNAPDFAEDEKQKIAERHEQVAADALAVQTPGAKTVTIDAAAKPEPGEPQFAAYLRAFADQTKLTVLAHWPSDSKAPDKKLSASIVGKPAGAALDILCQTYDGEWVQDEKTVRLRALPAKDSAPKKPTAAAPASAPVGGLSR